MPNWKESDIPDLTNKVVIVTGANSGVGYPVALEFARKHAKVYLACRNKQRGEDAIKRIKVQVPQANVVFGELDLNDLSSVRAFSEFIKEKETKVDILVNNAGFIKMVQDPGLELNKDGLETQFATNFIGHFLLTGLLIPFLKKSDSARVVNVTSDYHKKAKPLDFDNLDYSKGGYSGIDAYANSKLANLLFSFELQRRYPEMLITSAHPGLTATEGFNSEFAKYGGIRSWIMKLVSWLFIQTSEMGALPSMYAATGKVVKNGYYGPGGFGGMRGYPVQTEPSKLAKDPEVARKLWEYAESKSSIKY